MAKRELHPIPSRDPVSGGELYVSELTCEDSGVTIRGKFEIPRYSRLDADQLRFLETFLRARGILSSMETEMSMSYPTLRSRLDALLAALELEPLKDHKHEKNNAAKTKILDQLEKGEITAAEAKAKLRGEK